MLGPCGGFSRAVSCPSPEWGTVALLLSLLIFCACSDTQQWIGVSVGRVAEGLQERKPSSFSNAQMLRENSLFNFTWTLTTESYVWKQQRMRRQAYMFAMNSRWISITSSPYTCAVFLFTVFCWTSPVVSNVDSSFSNAVHECCKYHFTVVFCTNIYAKSSFFFFFFRFFRFMRNKYLCVMTSITLPPDFPLWRMLCAYIKDIVHDVSLAGCWGSKHQQGYVAVLVSNLGWYDTGYSVSRNNSWFCSGCVWSILVLYSTLRSDQRFIIVI